ncbi:tail fiber domain-containing protein [bacterium]|nr:tail fiber domain-containing protein [bacterium]
MNSRIKKAFSLTEVLIVLVIIAALFAAMAPMITKRHASDMLESESVWNFVPNDNNYDSYFNPGVDNWTSSAYVGEVPPAVKTSVSGKLVVNSGDVSNNGDTFKTHQMQFRFGSGRGLNSGSILLNDKNLLFGGNYSSFSGEYNTAAGISALSGIVKPYNSIAIGNFSMAENAASKNSNSHIIAIGDNSTRKMGSSENKSVDGIYIGSYSGSTTFSPDKNIAIGSHSMASIDTQADHNIFIGADTGSGFTSPNAKYNTIVGSKFYGGNASYNNIIGADVYTGIYDDISNMTAIGYKACESIPYSNETIGENEENICIGYKSAYSSNKSSKNFGYDNAQHIYIGGTPNGFSGRSVLEIHNFNNDSNPIVVLNSNLVVKGNLYPSDGSGNITYNNLTDSVSAGVDDNYQQCSADNYYSQILNTYSGFLCETLSNSGARSGNILLYGGTCGNNVYSMNSNCPNIISSDFRLKENFIKNNDGLDKILKLKPYNFVFKFDKLKKLQVGVIAQELKNVFPDSVSEDKNGFLKIRWDEMFYALINAVKTLNAKVENTISKISSLKSDLKVVKSDHKIIKKQISLLNARLNRLERR